MSGTGSEEEEEKDTVGELPPSRLPWLRSLAVALEDDVDISQVDDDAVVGKCHFPGTVN